MGRVFVNAAGVDDMAVVWDGGAGFVRDGTGFFGAEMDKDCQARCVCMYICT